MPSFITRLKWNDNQWQRPAKHTITEQTRYIRTHGFGFEEWLNRAEWKIAGWRYGFIQGVYKSRARLAGQEVDLMLYSVSPAGERVFVGVLRKARILEHDEATRAMREFRKRGWLKQMQAEAAAIGGDITPFKKGPSEAVDWFNVRFRPRALELFKPPRRPRKPADLKNRHRYQLYGASVSVLPPFQRRRKKVTSAQKGRITIPSRTLLLIENQMQNELEDLLRDQFGDTNVEREREHIDLLVSDRRKKVSFIIEVKSEPVPRLAIRSAIGQLLEYAFFPGVRRVLSRPKLVIVGRTAADASSLQYLEDLEEQFALEIHYRRYEPGTMDFTL